jgi:hypothetical protein
MCNVMKRQLSFMDLQLRIWHRRLTIALTVCIHAYIALHCFHIELTPAAVDCDRGKRWMLLKGAWGVYCSAER